MKKVLSLAIIAIMLIAGTFLLTGCGENADNDGGNSSKVEGSSENTQEKDVKEANTNEEVYQINPEHMKHFMIEGFNVDSSYSIYNYDYRDYIDTIKIYYVADETEQIRAAQYIFDKSKSYEAVARAGEISSIEEAKYWAGNSYRFHNGTYTYKIIFQTEAGEESIFNDLIIKANSVIIEITPIDL